MADTLTRQGPPAIRLGTARTPLPLLQMEYYLDAPVKLVQDHWNYLIGKIGESVCTTVRGMALENHEANQSQLLNLKKMLADYSADYLSLLETDWLILVSSPVYRELKKIGEQLLTALRQVYEQEVQSYERNYLKKVFLNKNATFILTYCESTFTFPINPEGMLQAAEYIELLVNSILGGSTLQNLENLEQSEFGQYDKLDAREQLLCDSAIHYVREDYRRYQQLQDLCAQPLLKLQIMLRRLNPDHAYLPALRSFLTIARDLHDGTVTNLVREFDQRCDQVSKKLVHPVLLS